MFLAPYHQGIYGYCFCSELCIFPEWGRESIHEGEPCYVLSVLQPLKFMQSNVSMESNMIKRNLIALLVDLKTVTAIMENMEFPKK